MFGGYIPFLSSKSHTTSTNRTQSFTTMNWSQSRAEVATSEGHAKLHALRLHGMSWGVKTTCFKARGVSLGGSGVSIGGVRSLGVWATVRKHSALLSMILYHAFCGKMTGSLYFMVVFKKILIYSFGLIFHLLYTIQQTKGPFCHCSNCLWLIHQREMQTNATIPTDCPASSSQMGNIAWKKMQHAK